MSNAIENKARSLWGDDLHKDKVIPAHSPQIQILFNEEWHHSFRGNLLEIGCGSGADLRLFSENENLTSITAIDIGENIHQLMNLYQDNKKIEILRANALSLPFSNNTFNCIYSFGVFHHTSNPKTCIKESYRVLEFGGSMFLYLYSKHEDILFKRIGIFMEEIIMKLFHYLPYRLQHLSCIFLSPICWFLFCMPSKITQTIGLESFSKKFPFYFGTHPFSLINDLKDRLMAPINHRFTVNEISRTLEECNFSMIRIKKNAAGLYIFAKK